MDENLLAEKVILVVDDENDLRDIVASEFEFMGAKVFQAENITAAKKVLTENKIDLIVSDIRMPGGTGIDLLDHVKSVDVHAPPIILITGFADITVEHAFGKGAEALMSKPFKLDDLIQMAVRFTAPRSERFSQEVPEHPKKNLTVKFTTTLQEKLDSGELKFGRGGLTTELDSRCMKCEVGEYVNFKLEYTDTTLQGIGICRWIKPLDQNEGNFTIGMEFICLEKNTLDSFSNSGDKRKVIEFIPSHS